MSMPVRPPDRPDGPAGASPAPRPAAASRPGAHRQSRQVADRATCLLRLALPGVHTVTGYHLCPGRGVSAVWLWGSATPTLPSGGALSNVSPDAPPP
jgi:hypothetical protein